MTTFPTIQLSMDWNDIVNKPLSFVPLAHTHQINQIIGLPTALAGKVPSTRNITINGTTYDLSQDRTWNVTGLGGGDFMADGTIAMTGDFDAGSNDIINVGTQQFDITPTLGAYSQGRLYWDTTHKTLSLDLGDGVTIQLGQESHIRVTNKTGTLIPNGSIVYINGIFADMPTVALAQANSISTSHIIGVATQDILVDGSGFITAFGSVSDLNTSTYTVGQPIYLSSGTPGAFTSTPISSPNISIQVGVVEKVGVTDGKIFVDIGVPMATDVNLTVGGSETSPTVTATKAYIDQRWIDVNRYGFVPGQTTITFDGVNTITLSPIGTTWSYYRAGLRHTITGAKSVTITGTPIATGFYFVFIDSTTGELQYTHNNAWTLDDTKVPVCMIYWNEAMTPKYIFSGERHTCLIDRREHMYNHYVNGTRYASGGALTGYALNTATAAGNTFGIDTANIFDEDLYLTMSALVDTNGTTPNYFIPYRTAVGTWAWTTSDMPFLYTGSAAPYTYLQWDNAGTMQAAVNNRWVNYYIVMTNARNDTEPVFGVSNNPARFAIIPGRGEYNTAVLAYAEQFSNFDLAGFPLVEGVAVWQVTFNTSGVANSVKGRCRIDRVQKISSNIISSATSTTANHDGLAGVNLAQASVLYGHIDDQAQTIAGAKTFSSDVTVPYEAYGVTWNGSNTVPTKDAIYDKIELKQDALVSGTNIKTVNSTTILGSGDIAVQATLVSGTNIKTINSTSILGSGDIVITAGGSYWTAVPGSPTCTGNTTFTLTDTSNTNKYDLLISRGTVVKWTESSTIRQAMVASATYATNTVTVTLVGDTMASIDASSLKYGAIKARELIFAYLPTVGTGTDMMGRWFAGEKTKVHGAIAYHGTAGTTNATTYDINKNGTTIFTTKLSVASAATVGSDTSANTTSYLDTNDYITIDCDSVSTTAPVYATIKVFVSPRNDIYLA